MTSKETIEVNLDILSKVCLGGLLNIPQCITQSWAAREEISPLTSSLANLHNSFGKPNGRTTQAADVNKLCDLWVHFMLGEFPLSALQLNKAAVNL